MIDVCFSHVLDERNLTQTQEKCLDLDIQATNILFRSLYNCILDEIMDKETAHEIWSYLNEKYLAPSDDHDDDSSVANYDSTPSTLDDQVGSCTDDIATSSSSPSPHCFMSQGDTNVSNCNVIDLNSYDELLSRHASMTKLFEEVLAKTIN